MAKNIQKPTVANLPPPQGGGQAPLPANIAKGAKAPAIAIPTAAPAKLPASAIKWTPVPSAPPKAQNPAAPKTAPAAKSAKVTTQTIGPKTTAKVAPGTKVTTKTVTTIGKGAPAPVVTPTPAPTTTRCPWYKRYNWKRIIGLILLLILLALLLKNAKPLYEKASRWFNSWNTPAMGAGGNTDDNNA